MSATDFDHYRATKSGRIEPSTFTAPDGSFVFALGAEALIERALITGGDFTEIKQTVNLEDVDLVGATFDTRAPADPGVLKPAQLPTLSDTLLNYPMNSNSRGALDDAPGAHHLTGVPALRQARETFGAAAGLCREIPALSFAGQLDGGNEPEVWSGALSAYSVDFLLNFDADSHVGSSGVDPVIFMLTDSPFASGLKIALSGAVGPGAHSWLISVTHGFFGVSSSSNTGAFTITASSGWHFFTVSWAGVGNAFDLFVDGALVDVGFSAFGVGPFNPYPDGAIQIADPDLWGAIDSVRLSNTYHGLAQHQADLAALQAAPTALDIHWLMQILIDGEVYVSRPVSASERRTWTDFFAPVRRLLGNHEVAFRLISEEG